MSATTRKRTARKANAAAAPSFTRTVSRWGNSLGIRLPQEGVDLLQISDGEIVIIEVKRDSLIIRPSKRRRKWTSAELVKGVAPAAIGGEFPWGPPVGREML